MVLAVEAASLITPFVPQLKPFAAMFENRPPWQKVALFGGLFFVPFILGSFGLFLLLGQICGNYNFFLQRLNLTYLKIFILQLWEWREFMC